MAFISDKLVPSASSKQAFDSSLREREAYRGIRWLHEVGARAEQAWLRLASRCEMPADNLLLVFERPVGESGSAECPISRQ